MASTGYNIPSIKRGQEVKGKIVAIYHNEIIVDIGAKSEGVVSGREFDNARDIAGKLSIGDEIEVTVVSVENDAGQVVLSLRKLSGERRWKELEDKKESGEDVSVQALEVNRGGIICDFVGLRGFLPSSQLTKPPVDLNDLVGRTLSVRILEVDRASNRLIFSQKQPGKKDLEEILKLLAKIEIGEKIKGVVTAVLPFGIFVEIEIKGREGREDNEGLEGKNKKSSQPSQSSEPSVPSKLEGLVHISEISWEKIDDPAQFFKVGDRVNVMVIAKDEATGRLNLSIKQLTDDPFLVVSKKYSKDQAVWVKVTKVTPYGVLVTLEDNVDGLIHISKIPPNVSFDIGQEVECVVDAIDTKARHLSLVPVVREKPVLYR